MQRYPNFKSSIASRIFGTFASKKFPSPVQRIINQSYTTLMRVDLSEFEKASFYPSLNALFTRKFKQARSFDTHASSIISPCDSYVSAFGTILDNLALQIKGFSYNVNNLLGDFIAKQAKERLEGGMFVNFYLSPRDYHRYHAPIDMKIVKAVHIPGKLFPVNFKWLRKIEGLFVENERVVLECYTKENQLFYMVFVGALNVGKMTFTFDANIQTNAKASLQQLYHYNDLTVFKGDELGHFEMGSTIVMLFEKDSMDLELSKEVHVKFGQPIGGLRYGARTNGITEADEQGDDPSIR